MSNNNRDDFLESTRKRLERQARGHCSNPGCRKLTSAASSDGQSEIRIGVGAHICAAAPGGERYDPSMTPAERSSAENGIWLCHDCSRAVDSKDPFFTVALLHEWKRKTDEDSWKSIVNNAPYGPHMNVPTLGEIARRLRSAASADLDVFRRTEKWPLTDVFLTLEIDAQSKRIEPSSIGRALATLDDLVVIASPGTGKTSALFQIAETALSGDAATPLIVPLAEWSSGNATIVESILRRPAFNGIAEADLRAVAGEPGVALILDGWNELDGRARLRAGDEIARLRAELPELTLIISTRRQALDVPFDGQRISVMELSDAQQEAIARALGGDYAIRLLDQAWRTPGVRDLVSIPLYLTALVRLPEGAPFPTTKEEILSQFVAVHEEDRKRAEIFADVTQGCQSQFLDGLAVAATRLANTAIPETNARQSIAQTDSMLIQDGQLTIAIQPPVVLATLVSHHVLVRAEESEGYSFQHQQFQEWYASHEVERAMLTSVGNEAALRVLKADVLNLREWEEAILFAIERMSRSDDAKQAACGVAIIAAFEVDPILAADMIYRATDEVWASIAGTIQERIGHWHTPGKCDRAFRFMMNSGRPEFLDSIWPLITHENDQVSLGALRNCRRFRPSLLGPDAAKRIKALPPQARTVLLHEMAFHSGMDGLDLATAVAKGDSDPEVQASVVDALSFRRADRHIAELLQGAKDATFDLVVRKGLVDEVNDEAVQQGIIAARKRYQESGMSTYDRLHSIIFTNDTQDRSAELATIISDMEIKDRQDPAVRLIYETWNRYPRAVAEGLLMRVRAGRNLFYGADDILAAAGFGLEDDYLVRLALADTERLDDQAEAAASVLGPQSVGRMIDALFNAATRLRDADGKYDKTAADRYHSIQSRIAHVPGASLVAATQARSAEADNAQIELLAELLSRHPDEVDRGRPFDAESLAAIRALIEDWGKRLLASGDAERRHIASVATLAHRAPDVSLLPLLKRMLDENLRHYRAFRKRQLPKAGGKARRRTRRVGQ